MRKQKAVIMAMAISIVFASCSKDDSAPKQQQETPAAQFPLSGHYIWTFEIPSMGTQNSHFVFYKDSIGYTMDGPVFSTDYIMVQKSYTEKNDEKRWIGVGKGGSIPKDNVYFVLFIKDITDSTATIYKHECTKGKEEAENFAYPRPDETADHGWNVYYKK